MEADRLREDLKSRLVLEIRAKSRGVGNHARVVLVSPDPAREPIVRGLGKAKDYGDHWVWAGVYDPGSPTFDPERMMDDVALARAEAQRTG